MSQSDDLQDSDSLPPPPSREKPMGFWEHLEELRGVLIKSLVAFLICAVLVGVFIKEFNDVLMWPLAVTKEKFPTFNIELGTQQIFEIFTMIIQTCLIGGLVLALPAILFFIGSFVSPALTERELKAVLPMCLSALFLFLVGAAFGFFFITPKALETSIELHGTFGLVARWTIGSYYSMLTWLVLGIGASFEFPLLIIILVWMGVLSTSFLKKYRRHAIVAIFIIAAIITPTPDPFVQTVCAAPLYLLFEVAIIVSRRIEVKRERKARFN